MNIRMIFIIILTMSLSFICLINFPYAIDLPVTKQKAIEIANNEVKKIGLDASSLRVKATKYDTPWNDYVPKDNKEYANDRNKLKNKEYWAVYYYNPLYKKGGDLCIFVDYNTGNVITKMRWR